MTMLLYLLTFLVAGAAAVVFASHASFIAIGEFTLSQRALILLLLGVALLLIAWIDIIDSNRMHRSSEHQAPISNTERSDDQNS